MIAREMYTINTVVYPSAAGEVTKLAQIYRLETVGWGAREGRVCASPLQTMLPDVQVEMVKRRVIFTEIHLVLQSRHTIDILGVKYGPFHATICAILYIYLSFK